LIIQILTVILLLVKSGSDVHFAFLVGAINDLEILNADVAYVYPSTPTREKVYTTTGPAFGVWFKIKWCLEGTLT
jgi:hypothetical protein